MMEQLRKAINISSVNDKEIDAISFIIEAIKDLDAPKQKRVMDYVISRAMDKQFNYLDEPVD